MKKLKVLLNDGLALEGIQLFKTVGIEVDLKKRNINQLITEIGNFDALIVRSATRVTKTIIEAGAKGKLKIIGRAGVGYENIDIESASENGCAVYPSP